MLRCVLAVLALSMALVPARVPAAELPAWVNEKLPGLVAFYRELHQHPELSFKEEQTAKRLTARLRAAGVEVTGNVGGHGVVGILKNGPGPTVMLRTDMDALPVTEQTNLAYSSKVRVKLPSGEMTGVMHACGHDVHMTNLVGVAGYLAAHKERWSGTLILVCQPAEERGAGAKAMLADGLFKTFPRPDYALALHVDSGLAAGKVGYRAGYAMANVDSVDITIRGRGGHGAQPHTTIDPIVLAARLVLDLQTIVSREVAPTDPAVVTVGSIHGGTKHNVIGDSCHLQLTVRSYTDEVRKTLLSGIKRKALAVAASASAPEPIIRISESGTPALYNNKELVERVLPIFREKLGEANVVQVPQTMGGEDFARYGLAGVPIFMWRLGSVEQPRLMRFEELGQKPPSLHSPVYYPDVEPTLKTGIVSMASAVLELMPPQEK